MDAPHLPTPPGEPAPEPGERPRLHGLSGWRRSFATSGALHGAFLLAAGVAVLVGGGEARPVEAGSARLRIAPPPTPAFEELEPEPPRIEEPPLREPELEPRETWEERPDPARPVEVADFPDPEGLLAELPVGGPELDLSPPPPVAATQEPADEESDVSAEPVPAGDAEPLLLESPDPLYPALARRRGWQGTVVCSLLVEADGTVGEVRVEQSSGHEVLDEAAVEGLRAWRFRPGLRGGGPSPVVIEHRVLFRLEEPEAASRL